MIKKASSFRDKNYYLIAHKGSSDLSHPAMKILRNYAKQAKKLVDLGCGEGTRVYEITKGVNVKAYGIDQSATAIKDAKKNYPNIKFLKGNLKNIPFEEEKFDLVFSAYVFEHLEDPEKVLMEAKRILKKSGKIVLIAPNYGSPNRRSPNSDEKKIEKLSKGFIKDLKFLFSKDSNLRWHKVKPKFKEYVIDADTTVEPYLNSLMLYLTVLGFKIIYSSSYWDIDRFTLFQFPFRILGSLGVYPFKYWGPHLCLVAEKN